MKRIIIHGTKGLHRLIGFTRFPEETEITVSQHVIDTCRQAGINITVLGDERKPVAEQSAADEPVTENPYLTASPSDERPLLKIDK